MSSRLPTDEALEKEDRIDEIKKKENITHPSKMLNYSLYSRLGNNAKYFSQGTGTDLMCYCLGSPRAEGNNMPSRYLSRGKNLVALNKYFII